MPHQVISDRVRIDQINQSLLVDGQAMPVSAAAKQTVFSTSDVKFSGLSWGTAASVALSALYFAATNPDQVLPYLRVLPPTVEIPLAAAVIGIGAAYRFYLSRKTAVVSPEEKQAIERAGY